MHWGTLNNTQKATWKMCHTYVQWFRDIQVLPEQNDLQSIFLSADDYV